MDVSNSSILITKHPSPVKLHVVFHKGQFLALFCFLLFINGISNFAVEGCVLNMYADDVIIYASAMSTHELECKLQSCIDSISNWYDLNKLCINKKKSSVMVIGSKFQLRSLNLDDLLYL